MIEYYLFSAFVFVLVCLSFIVWRIVFSGFKKSQKQLEQKKDELNAILEAIRKEADDFYDMASEKLEEITVERKRVSALASGLALKPSLKETVTTADSAVVYKYVGSEHTPPVGGVKPALINNFQKAIEDAARKHNVPTSGDGVREDPVSLTPNIKSVSLPIQTPYTLSAAAVKRDKIMHMLEKGVSPVKVAKELGVARNEVDLVIKTVKRGEFAST